LKYIVPVERRCFAMKNKIPIALVALVVLTTTPVTSHAEGPLLQAPLKLDAPVHLPRLFNVPTANVLGSLDAYLTGGGAFGAEKERYFVGRGGIGLGDVAEIEVSTWSVISTLRKTSSNIPTTAFKMRLLRERKDLPAIAWALRGTTNWQQLDGSDPGVSFKTRLTKLHVVATKSRGNVSGHFGVGLTDVRVINPQGWSFEESEKDELQRNLIAPFAGVSVRANPRTLVMAEVDGVPQYAFTAEKANRSDAIKTVWAGVVGVRFYFTNTFATDAGVRYRSDFDGIADANVQASVSLLIPLAELPKRKHKDR
jgi:hypothetical protein